MSDEYFYLETPDSSLNTNVINPEGPTDAKIMFVGDAPGEQEDYECRPFVGSGGQLLNRCLQQKNILRGDCLLTNIFCRKPPRSNINYYFQDKSNTKPTWEGQDHINNLKKWYDNLPQKPNIIVALGAIPLKILTGKKRISKWRGTLLESTLFEGAKVYPTYHPSYVNRLINEKSEALQGQKKKDQQNVLPVFLIDLERIASQSHSPELSLPKRQIEINLSFSELMSRLEALNTKSPELLAVDIETLPGPTGPVLWCIGFSDHPSRAFVVPFVESFRFKWSVTQEADLLINISKVFLSRKIKKIFQGGTYDLAVLGRYYGLRVADGTYEDTMWCHHSSYPYIRKGLDLLTSIYTWEPYFKDEGKVHMGKRSADSAEFIYNGKDCCVTREIFPITLQNAHENKTIEGYRRSIAVVPSLLAMTLRGVKIDTEAKAELIKEFTAKKIIHKEKIETFYGQEINLESSKQKIAFLYVHMGLKMQYNRKTGKPTADKDAIEKLKKKYPSKKILDDLMEYQKYTKLLSTYAEMKLDYLDQRARTSYQFISTWRLSSSSAPFIFDLEKKKQEGANLQNIPVRSEEGKLVRKLFIPDEGKVFLASDLTQAEAQVVAWESEDLAEMKNFQTPGFDVHWSKAKSIFKLPPDLEYIPNAKVSDIMTASENEMKIYRTLGKTIVHACNYDMGPMQLQAILRTNGFHFDTSLCKKLLQSYKANKPHLEEWKRCIREKIKATRVLISSYGRKRTFMGRLNDQLYRAAYAFSPQNTVGEILTDAIKEINAEVDCVEILLNVHDEVIVQVKPEDLQRAGREIKKRMERKLVIHDRELIIPCDFKTGKSWGELEEIEIEN